METKPVVLCDTDVLIEFYKENGEIVSELHAIGQSNIAVSIITAGELMYGALNKSELKKIHEDLLHLSILDANPAICKIFFELMNRYTLSHRLAVPDAVIAATAKEYKIPLYTLNRKDFRYIDGVSLYK